MYWESKFVVSKKIFTKTWVCVKSPYPPLGTLSQVFLCFYPRPFADDGALCFRGIDPNTLVANTQKQLNQVIEWGAQNGLSFCPDKTTVVFFTRKYNFHKKVLPMVKKIKMSGVEINHSSSMTYLGIILDQKLNWSLHIKTKVSKAIKWLAMIKPAINYIYGLSPARML